MTIDSKARQNPSLSINPSNQISKNITMTRKYSKMNMLRRLLSVGVILQLLGNIGKQFNKQRIYKSLFLFLLKPYKLAMGIQIENKHKLLFIFEDFIDFCVYFLLHEQSQTIVQAFADLGFFYSSKEIYEEGKYFPIDLIYFLFVLGHQ